MFQTTYLHPTLAPYLKNYESTLRPNHTRKRWCTYQYYNAKQKECLKLTLQTLALFGVPKSFSPSSLPRALGRKIKSHTCFFTLPFNNCPKHYQLGKIEGQGDSLHRNKMESERRVRKQYTIVLVQYWASIKRRGEYKHCLKQRGVYV